MIDESCFLKGYDLYPWCYWRDAFCLNLQVDFSKEEARQQVNILFTFDDLRRNLNGNDDCCLDMAVPLFAALWIVLFTLCFI